MRWMAGASWNRRKVLAIAERLRPTRCGHVLLGQPEVLDELLVGRRLLERVEILAVEVLDQRLLER